MKPYKEVEKIMKSKKYNKEIEWLRAHRSTSVDLKNDRLELRKRLLPVYQDINNVLRNYQKIAELELLTERPDIAETITKQLVINEEMKKGNVEGAAYIQQENLKQRKNLEKQELLQYGGSR